MRYFGISLCVLTVVVLLGAGAKPNPGSSAAAGSGSSNAAASGAQSQPAPAGNPGGLPMTAAAAPTAAPPMFFRRKTLFVLAVAGDPATSAKLSVETARTIMASKALADGAWAISAPGWGIQEFINQCSARPESTIGALIYYNAVQENGNNNYLLIARGTTQIDADALIAECLDPTKNPAEPIQIDWVGNDAVGLGSRNSFSFLPLAAIATAISAFNTAHSVSSETDTTYNFPSSTPRPNGSVSAGQVVNKTTSTKNASDATTLLAAAALTQLGSANTNVPGNNGDPQLKSAVQHIASDVLRLVRTSCLDDDELLNPPCTWFVQSRLPGPRTDHDERSTAVLNRNPIVPSHIATPLPSPGPNERPATFPSPTMPIATPSPTPTRTP
jgi:hypothetical protein